MKWQGKHDKTGNTWTNFQPTNNYLGYYFVISNFQFSLFYV